MNLTTLGRNLQFVLASYSCRSGRPNRASAGTAVIEYFRVPSAPRFPGRHQPRCRGISRSTQAWSVLYRPKVLGVSLDHLCASSKTDRKPRQRLDRTPSLKIVKPDDGDTRELARPKGCHQNSVDEPVDGQDLSTLKRRYECQPAQPLAHQRIPVFQPNLFTLKHRYRYAETPIRAR